MPPGNSIIIMSCLVIVIVLFSFIHVTGKLHLQVAVDNYALLWMCESD